MSFTTDFIAAATGDIRCPKALIEVTWGTSESDKNRVISSNSSINRIDRTGQLFNDVTTSGQKWAYIHSGLIADGSFYAMPEVDTDAQAGWFGNNNFVADGSGEFTADPYIQVSHDARSYGAITVAGDSAYDEYPVDFTIEFTHDGGPTNIAVTGNTERVYQSTFTALKDVTSLKLTIHKWSAVNTIVKVTQFSGSLIETYDSSDIVELSILEETNSDTGVVPIGNVSANELSFTLLNTDRRFSFGNTDSPYITALKSGVKVRAWLGFVLPSGSSDASGDVTGYLVRTENGDKVGYMPYGIYWTKDWISSYDSMETSTTAYDVAYKLSQRDFLKSGNYSGTVASIVNSVLTLALADVPDLTWEVSSDTSSETLSNFYFAKQSYLDVLKDLAEATLSYSYVDRNGKLIIGARLNAGVVTESYQNVTLSDYFNFNSQPKLDEVVNKIRVGYTSYTLEASDTLYPDDKTFTIPTGETSISLVLEWDNVPALASSVSLAIVPVSGVPLLASSNIYATGADLTVTGAAGYSFTIAATGQYYSLDENAETTAEDAESIDIYGIREFEIKGNKLITTEQQAQDIANNLLSFYGALRQDGSLSWPASTLVSVGDTLYVTEFKSDTVETKDYFIVKRQSINFNGSLDADMELRRG